jgi:hypothetical protein
MKSLFWSIKPRLPFAFWLAALLLCFSLSLRLVWLASRTETGFSTLGMQWRDATLGWILGEHQPIYLREPAEQADFWLRETDRVLKAHPNDARLAMGAALLLDAPNHEFEIKHSKAQKIMGTIFPQFNEEPLKRAENAFEKSCKDRCLELAACATAMESENVQWWRLHALLLFRQPMHSFDDTPRDRQWVTVLNECRRHDPDNALYDYLAAKYYWETGLGMDFTGNQEKLVVKDAVSFQKGMECFTAGQAKPHCSVGDVGFTATADFLTHSKLPISEQAEVVNGRYVQLRRQDLLARLWRRQGYQAADKAAAGDFEKSLAMERQNLHLYDQFAAVEPSSRFDQVAIMCRSVIVQRLKALVDEPKNSFSPTAVKEIDDLQNSVLIDKMVVEKAAQSLPKNQKRMRAGNLTAHDVIEFFSDLLMGIAPSTIVLLLFVGAVAFALGRSVAKNDVPKLRPIGQIAALLAATAISFVFFGLAPAEIFSRKAQMWFFSVALLLSPVVVIFWMVWFWLKKRAYQFTIRALLIGTLIFYLLCGLVSALWGLVADLPFQLWIPARNMGGIDVGFIEPAIRAYGDAGWAVYQWVAYGGGYIALAIWAALMTLGYVHKIGKYQRQPEATCLTWTQRIAGLFRTLGRPAIALALPILLAYLAFVPNLLERTEKDFQEKIAFARHPEKYWAEVAKCVEQVRANEAEMKIIREGVKEWKAAQGEPQEK